MSKNDKGYFYVSYPDSLKEFATSYLSELENHGMNFKINTLNKDDAINASKIVIFIDNTCDANYLKELIYLGFDNKKTVITIRTTDIDMDRELNDLLGSTYIIKNNKRILSNLKEALLMLSIVERNTRRKKIYSFFVIIILLLSIITMFINSR